MQPFKKCEGYEPINSTWLEIQTWEIAGSKFQCLKIDNIGIYIIVVFLVLTFFTILIVANSIIFAVQNVGDRLAQSVFFLHIKDIFQEVEDISNCLPRLSIIISLPVLKVCTFE